MTLNRGICGRRILKFTRNKHKVWSWNAHFVKIRLKPALLNKYFVQKWKYQHRLSVPFAAKSNFLFCATNSLCINAPVVLVDKT